MSPAYREPQWDEERRFRGSFDFATAPPLSLSGNPLLTLLTSDALAFLGTAFGLKPGDVAKSLAISRQTYYQALKRARAVLEPVAEPRLSRRCIACGGPRPPGRVRCGECWEASEKKRAAGRKGAAQRWCKLIGVKPRTAAGARAQAGGDGAGA